MQTRPTYYSQGDETFLFNGMTYNYTRTLGEGAGGNVYLFINKNDKDDKIVLKELNRHYTEGVYLKALNEIYIGSIMLGFSVGFIDPELSFSDSAPAYSAIAMKYIDGVSLFETEDNSFNNIEDLMQINIDILEAVKEMHAKGIAHGDLALRNIMVQLRDNKIRPVICDFGDAESFQKYKEKFKNDEKHTVPETQIINSWKGRLIEDVINVLKATDILCAKNKKLLPDNMIQTLINEPIKALLQELNQASIYLTKEPEEYLDRVIEQWKTIADNIKTALLQREDKQKDAKQVTQDIEEAKHKDDNILSKYIPNEQQKFIAEIKNDLELFYSENALLLTGLTNQHPRNIISIISWAENISNEVKDRIILAALKEDIEIIPARGFAQENIFETMITCQLNQSLLYLLEKENHTQAPPEKILEVALTQFSFLINATAEEQKEMHAFKTPLENTIKAILTTIHESNLTINLPQLLTNQNISAEKIEYQQLNNFYDSMQNTNTQDSTAHQHIRPG